MLVIRADGNAKIGAGHLMRCLTIAEAVRAELRRKQEGAELAEILFLCADEDSASMVRSHGFEADVLYTDHRNMESELGDGGNQGSGWKRCGTDARNVILVDSYFVTDAYLRKLQEYGRVFLLDDLQDHCYPVDGVINYNAFADPSVYRKLYQKTETVCFLGADYVPLREQFRDAKYTMQESVRHVMITTGGGDEENIADQILDLVNTSEIVFHVLVGRFSPHFEEWQERAARMDRLQIHYDVREMADLMCGCDLAITAGGSTVYELAAVGVPFICFSYAENQEALVNYVGERQIAGSAGAWHRNREACMAKMDELFARLCKDSALRKEYSERERRMADGKGAGRIAELLIRGWLKSES